MRQGGYPIDFLIVTPLSEERDAVLGLADWEKVPPDDQDSRVYFRTQLPFTLPNGGAGTYEVVLVPLRDMGTSQGAATTNDAIRRWAPRHTLLVGIAGGIRSSGVALGDVLIAEQVVDYSLQKRKPDETETRFRAFPVDSGLLEAAKVFDGKAWLAYTSDSRPETGAPEVRFGVVASGNTVIADAGVVEEYKKAWPMLVGVEMEAGGVCLAATQSAPPSRFFMVRCVSDLADAEKDDDRVLRWWPYACRVAAAYAIEFLKTGPVAPIRPPVPVPSDPGTSDFVRKVARTYERLGFKPTHDFSAELQDVDLILECVDQGTGPDRFAVRCVFRTEEPVSREDVLGFQATISAAASAHRLTRGVLVTNGSFDDGATHVAGQDNLVHLVTFSSLEEAVFGSRDLYAQYISSYEKRDIHHAYIRLRGRIDRSSSWCGLNELPDVEESLHKWIESSP